MVCLPVDVSYVNELSKEDVRARQFSTLDLCHFDRFTLLAPSREAWSARYEDARTKLKARGSDLGLWAAGSDFSFVYKSQLDLFDRGVGWLGGGALLVRPDQHVLGILDSETTADEVVSLIRSHLGDTP